MVGESDRTIQKKGVLRPFFEYPFRAISAFSEICRHRHIYKPLPPNFRTWEIPLCRVVPDLCRVVPDFCYFCLVTIPFLKLYSSSNSSIYLLSVLSETWQFVGLYIAENLATPAS